MSVFSYTSRDFDTIRSDMLARASAVMPEWTERDPSDFGMLLVDLWAHAADVMHYYIDRAAGESQLSSATQRESVLAVANLLDYTPRNRSSAISVISFTNVSSATVTVPQYSELIARYNSKTYKCYTPAAVSVPANSTVTGAVIEGTRHSGDTLATSGTSTGAVGQRYSIRTTNVNPSSVQVYVYEDGDTGTPVEYRRVLRIIDAPTGDRVFSTYSSADGTTQVVFGNFLNGFVPPAGSKITTSYVESSGADGNLPANCITSFSGVTPTGITIASSTSFVGGYDDESIESLKLSIPIAAGTNNRAVTRSDFIALATQVPGVAKAALSFTPGLAASAGLVGTNSSVTIYPQVYRSDYLTTASASQVVDSATQALVVSTLQPLALLGVTVLSAASISWTGIDVTVELHVQDRFIQLDVKNAVSSALDELFAFDNVFFGQRLHLGQVYRIINGVSGVDYAIITKFDITGSGASSVQTSILIDPLKLPKKGAYVITPTGGTT